MDPPINSRMETPRQVPPPQVWPTGPATWPAQAQMGHPAQSFPQPQYDRGQSARSRRPASSDVNSPQAQMARHHNIEHNRNQAQNAPGTAAPPAQQQLFAGQANAASMYGAMYGALQEPSGPYSGQASPSHFSSTYATSDQVSERSGAGEPGEAHTCTPGCQTFRPARALIA